MKSSENVADAVDMYLEAASGGYRLYFTINGTKTYTYQKMEPTPEGQFPFADHPFYIILSAQLGGSWVGKVNIEELPVKMEIDYVRFYERR